MSEQTEIQADQEEMFPKTPREIADEFLEHFQADVEAAEKSLYNARKKLREAMTLRDHAELNLKRAIDAELGTAQAEAVEEGYMIDAPAEEVEDAEVVDEEEEQRLVEEEANRAWEKAKVDAAVEQAEDMITQPAPAAMVWVQWPGHQEDEFISLVVGPLTRFGELVANYLNANPDADILARYVITGSDGVVWNPKAVIGSENYGFEFTISKQSKGEPA